MPYLTVALQLQRIPIRRTLDQRPEPPGFFQIIIRFFGNVGLQEIMGLLFPLRDGKYFAPQSVTRKRKERTGSSAGNIPHDRLKSPPRNIPEKPEVIASDVQVPRKQAERVPAYEFFMIKQGDLFSF